MSTQFSIGEVDKMVIISAPSNAPVDSKASDELQKLTKLAFGKGIPEEKSKSILSVAEDGTKKNEQEENELSAPSVMEAAGTPAEYPSNESVAKEEDLINEAILQKRADRQVELGTISHYICTNNLAGLVSMRLFGKGLDNVLRNMIDDSINVICDRMGNNNGKANYITRSVMFDWLCANLHKVELWQLIDKSTKDVYQFILDKMNSHSTDTRAKKKRRTWYQLVDLGIKLLVSFSSKRGCWNS